MSLYGWTEYQPKVIYVNWLRNTTKTSSSQFVDNEILQKVAFKQRRQVKTRLHFEDREISALTGQFFSKKELSEIVPCNFTSIVPQYAKTLSKEKLFIERSLIINTSAVPTLSGIL